MRLARTATLFALVVLVVASLTGCSTQPNGYTYQPAPAVHPDTGVNYFSGKRNVPSGWAGNTWLRHLQNGDLQGKGDPRTPRDGRFRAYLPLEHPTMERVVTYVDHVEDRLNQAQRAAAPQPVVYDWTWLIPWVLGALLLGWLAWLLTRPRGTAPQTTTTSTSLVKDEPDTYRYRGNDTRQEKTCMCRNNCRCGDVHVYCGDRNGRNGNGNNRGNNDSRGYSNGYSRSQDNSYGRGYTQEVLPPGYSNGPVRVKDSGARRELRAIAERLDRQNALLERLLTQKQTIEQQRGIKVRIREDRNRQSMQRSLPSGNETDLRKEVAELRKLLQGLDKKVDSNDARVRAEIVQVNERVGRVEQDVMSLAEAVRAAAAAISDVRGEMRQALDGLREETGRQAELLARARGQR